MRLSQLKTSITEMGDPEGLSLIEKIQASRADKAQAKAAAAKRKPKRSPRTKAPVKKKEPSLSAVEKELKRRGLL